MSRDEHVPGLTWGCETGNTPGSETPVRLNSPREMALWS